MHKFIRLERPMSDADLEAKFRGLAEGILTDQQSSAVIRLSWDVAQLADAGAIARATAAQHL
ncbi:MAG: hypothetical protein ACTS5G_01690 [Burkholderiales bacterium]